MGKERRDPMRTDAPAHGSDAAMDMMRTRMGKT